VLQCSSNKILQSEYKGTDGIILGKGEKIEFYKFNRYKLNEIKVVRDSIIINLSYSGGCRDHVFNLIANNYFGDSTEPHAKLVLSHDNKMDPCEAYLTEKQFFNLLPLKYEYMKLFGKEIGSIRLVLEEREVVYMF